MRDNERERQRAKTWLGSLSPMKSIYRLDERSMCGWVVKFKRQKKTFHKYFHDSVGGPPESLRQAIAYRDEQIQRLPTPTRIWVTPPKEKGGTRGVTREAAATPSGHVAESWRAYWVEVDGKVGRRSFSVHKYGEKEAKAMALAARKEAVARVLKERRQRLLTGVLAGPSGRPVTRPRRRTRRAPAEGDPGA
jgi:hypothetical protein